MTVTRQYTIQPAMLEGLVCPRSKEPMQLVEAEAEATSLIKIPRTGSATGDYGFGDGGEFLRLPDGTCYAVADGFPVLMYPEKLVARAFSEAVDLGDPRYAEAYQEMAHYNAIGNEGTSHVDDETVGRLMGRLTRNTPAQTYPDPAYGWVDARHDSTAQYEAYAYLAPLTGKSYLQLGGSGSHAVKALLAGARHAMLLTPMLGEARQGRALAEYFGVADRFHAVIAIGEELPFADETYDAIYSGGCVHHMRTEYAFKELQRVLAPGGRFSSVDPWKTLLHAFGTKVFGKREGGVFCRPIDVARIAPISIFEKSLVKRHGPFLRYVFIVAEKYGIRLPVSTMLKIGTPDDGFGKLFGILDKYGSSIVFGAEKAATRK